jgi:hypothetical protein
MKKVLYGICVGLSVVLALTVIDVHMLSSRNMRSVQNFFARSGHDNVLPPDSVQDTGSSRIPGIPQSGTGNGSSELETTREPPRDGSVDSQLPSDGLQTPLPS